MGISAGRIGPQESRIGGAVNIQPDAWNIICRAGHPINPGCNLVNCAGATWPKAIGGRGCPITGLHKGRGKERAAVALIGQPKGRADFDRINHSGHFAWIIIGRKAIRHRAALAVSRYPTNRIRHTDQGSGEGGGDIAIHIGLGHDTRQAFTIVTGIENTQIDIGCLTGRGHKLCTRAITCTMSRWSITAR